MRLVFLTLIALIAAALAQAPQPPNLPLTFQANIKITNSAIPFPVSGTLYYDYPNNMQRIDQSTFGQTVTTLDRWDLMTQYQFAGPRCQCAKENTTMNQFFIAPGAEWVGVNTINGVSCNGWQTEIFGVVTFTIWTAVSGAQSLVEANVTVSNGPFTVTTLISFSNVQPTTFASSIFAIPSSCASACPTPSPPQPSGSCPNSPAAGCGCVSGSLSFCSLVNYPVPTQLVSTAQSVDSFVENAFNLQLSVIPSPSQACKDNLQSFLCAFYFPSCSTGGVTFVPCGNLCPLCSCSVFGNSCPLNGTSITTACTQYGKGYCS